MQNEHDNLKTDKNNVSADLVIKLDKPSSATEVI